MLNKLITEWSAWWKLHSVKLAALMGILTGIITENQTLVLGIIGIIPTDPVMRAMFAGGVGALVFLVPTIARLWPQDITISKEKTDGDQSA